MFGVKADLIVDFVETSDPAAAARYAMPAPFLLGRWDFVLSRAAGQPAGVISTED